MDAQRKHYLANRQRLIQEAVARKAEVVKANRAYVQALKEQTSCTDCGVSYPYYVMDFDHLSDKTKAITVLVGNGVSKATLDKEIAKCEIVCANCHRIRTWVRSSDGRATD